MSLPAGAQLGPYEIVSRIGAGGMGEVYKARDTRINRMVAIKVSQEQFSERFAREANAVAALNHPNICTLYDVGPNYLVMELLEGGTLASRLQKGPLPVAEALKYGGQIAAALDAAHRVGMTHRDLKPQNIVITRTGAKLLDFGLAKIKPNATVQDVTLTKPLTTEGVIVGTYQYMAPETLAGKEADHRSDIFAFGSVLYEMLTGHRAFDGTSQAAIFGAILHTEPAPIVSMQPMAPPAVDRVVRKCLAKDPEDRWQSARDLAAELSWLAEAGSHTGSASTGKVEDTLTWRRPLRWAALASVVLAAAVLSALVGYKWRLAPDRPPAAKFILPLPGGHGVGRPVISPNGQKIAFTGGPPEARQIYLHSLALNAAQPLSGTEEGSPLAFSPDSNHLAFGAGRNLFRIDLTNGAVQQIETASYRVGTAPHWVSDNVILVNGGNGAVYQMPANGGETRPVTALNAEREESMHHVNSILPDGRHFLYLAYTVSFAKRTVLAGRLDDPAWRKIILEGTGPAVYDQLSGQLVFTRGNSLFAQPFDPGKLEATGQPYLIAERLAGMQNAPNLAVAFSVSKAGVLVYRTRLNVNSQVSWYDRSGRKLSDVGGPGEVSNPTISPDGSRVVLTIRDPGTRTRDLWVYNTSGGAPLRLTFDAAEDFNPAWSPDGQWIAFSSNRKGHKDIYRRRADGSGGDEELLASNFDKNVEHWSPDGRFLVFNTFLLPGRGDLHLLPMSGGAPRTVMDLLKTPLNEQQATVSPDGRWIAYSSTEAGALDIFVRPMPWGGMPAGRWQVSNGSAVEPRWRGDGRELYYRSSTSLIAVPVTTAGQTFQAGAAVPLMPLRPRLSLRNSYDVSPDGQRFLLEVPVTADQNDPPVVITNWPSLLPKTTGGR